MNQHTLSNYLQKREITLTFGTYMQVADGYGVDILHSILLFYDEFYLQTMIHSYDYLQNEQFMTEIGANT